MLYIQDQAGTSCAGTDANKAVSLSLAFPQEVIWSRVRWSRVLQTLVKAFLADLLVSGFGFGVGFRV